MNWCLDTELVKTPQKPMAFIFWFHHEKNIERMAENKQTNKQTKSPFSQVSMEIYINSIPTY